METSLPRIRPSTSTFLRLLKTCISNSVKAILPRSHLFQSPHFPLSSSESLCLLPLVFLHVVIAVVTASYLV